jgi:hypothetical protein
MARYITIGAFCLLASLVGPAISFAAQDASSSQAQQAASPTAEPQTVPGPPSGVQLPDSPGMVRSLTTADQAQSDPRVSFTAQQDQSQPQQPVGTAAAGIAPVTGVAASKPAGAAIAPAKQRRVRTLLIEVGAIVGAGVAVGTVAALSSASPSRPPGAH